ncbi:CLUMA_CG008259, isoform A [Clunio marinus]|uniref:CLUMA_CG008259, isoform A n=1 Tax=Clunio marinus TaxID=568069 RepID=A0A1J1I388_9DIPT|nr:CLUMA_CG008259, isoform A [Clunio marinus]
MTTTCRIGHNKLNHHNGLTKCLQMAGKLLSTFVFRFQAIDRQQICDSVLPRKKEKNKNYRLKITSFFMTKFAVAEA